MFFLCAGPLERIPALNHPESTPLVAAATLGTLHLSVSNLTWIFVRAKKLIYFLCIFENRVANILIAGISCMFSWPLKVTSPVLARSAEGKIFAGLIKFVPNSSQ